MVENTSLGAEPKPDTPPDGNTEASLATAPLRSGADVPDFTYLVAVRRARRAFDRLPVGSTASKAAGTGWSSCAESGMGAAACTAASLWGSMVSRAGPEMCGGV